MSEGFVSTPESFTSSFRVESLLPMAVLPLETESREGESLPHELRLPNDDRAAPNFDSRGFINMPMENGTSSQHYIT